MKKLLAVICIFICSCCLAQETQSFEKDGDCYQYEVLNELTKPTALLVLFDGGAGKAKKILPETAIPDSAAQHGFLVIGIDQSEFFLDENSYSRIASIINHVKKKNALSKNLFLGGFSLGGFIALRFSEMAVERKDQALIPNAVFAVDPPLDHAELRKYCLRELARVCDKKEALELGKAEAQWILNYYEQNFGPFAEDKDNYVHHSCFSTNDPQGGNAIFLKDIPVILFHEVDLEWLMEERCREYQDCNAFIGEKFIEYLHSVGNENAVITKTEGLGFRADGRRHPHSWSIASPEFTLAWLLKHVQR